MKTVKIALIAILSFIGVATFTPAYVSAQTPAEEIQDGINEIRDDEDTTSVPGAFRTIVNVLLFLIGAIAVIMVIIGGIRYVTSGGDSSQITSAKNTILYAVIGVVVAILAYAIVNFVIDQFTS